MGGIPTNGTVTSPPPGPQEAEQPFLPFALPSIGEEEVADATEALRSGWLTTGPRTKETAEGAEDAQSTQRGAG